MSLQRHESENGALPSGFLSVLCPGMAKVPPVGSGGEIGASEEVCMDHDLSLSAGDWRWKHLAVVRKHV